MIAMSTTATMRVMSQPASSADISDMPEMLRTQIHAELLVQKPLGQHQLLADIGGFSADFWNRRVISDQRNGRPTHWEARAAEFACSGHSRELGVATERHGTPGNVRGATNTKTH